MIGFPQAKINLGLSVLSKRTDGFHELETVYYSIPLRDVLEFIPAAQSSFSVSGLSLPGKPEENLVIHALNRIRKQFPQVGPLEVHLYKSIPSGAGLGGGSADAAGMLKMLNDYFDLHIPQEELKSLALELGSDCPFFLQSSPCYARGRGEILEPLSLDLSGYSMLLVHPQLHISTAWAFSRIRPALPGTDLKDLISAPPGSWRDRLKNDFEKPVFEKYPELRKIKMQLYEAGAVYASLTGSGSSLYGIFDKNGIPSGGISATLQQTVLI